MNNEQSTTNAIQNKPNSNPILKQKSDVRKQITEESKQSRDREGAVKRPDYSFSGVACIEGSVGRPWRRRNYRQTFSLVKMSFFVILQT